MGLESNKPEYQISKSDAHIIQAYQVCKFFNCFDYNIYRNNPAWWNAACFALIKTEKKVESDRIEENGNS